MVGLCLTIASIPFQLSYEERLQKGEACVHPPVDIEDLYVHNLEIGTKLRGSGF
jgi:hypothetical protein